MNAPLPLMDPMGRVITYLRLSLTDRCDLRCTYCMSDGTRFVPRDQVLSFEETARLTAAFAACGVRKLRLTGGEPLARPHVMTLIKMLSRHLDQGRLDEIAMTTNGTRLPELAGELAAVGIRRLNISLDTLDPATFRAITRVGDVSKVLAGIDAAQAAGLAVKINCVVQKGVNDHEIDHLIPWCGERGFDLTLIERMPFAGHNARDGFVSLTALRRDLEQRWTLTALPIVSGGPAHYVRVEETGGQLGFISALSHNFCDSCNRVRLTIQGQLALCLGHDHMIDLKPVVRDSRLDDEALAQHLRQIMVHKPARHQFQDQFLLRPMSSTGG